MVRQEIHRNKPSILRRLKWSIRKKWRWFLALKWWQKVLLIGLPILAFLIIVPLITYAIFASDISDQERLMNRNNTGIVIYDKNGKELYTSGRAVHSELVPLDQISDTMEHALVASEDKNFYKHGGFSFTSILGALYGNFVSGGNNYGGSTLTQQLAKNTLLTSDRNFLRKYQELSIALAIEQTYSKEQILDMYLNSVFYGEGAFGIKDAADIYFNKSPADLDLAESAMLVGVLPAPSAYSPISGDLELAKERQTTVLTRMVNNGFITEADKKAALAEELTYAEPETTTGKAPHFVEMVLDELYDKYGEERVTRSGFQVTTTLDSTLQDQLLANIDNRIAYIQANGGSNAAGIAIDPTSGAILALAGSADWDNEKWGKVNMATTPRQPGSSFKPVYYSEALAKGVITPATIFNDAPIDINGYSPQNASRTYSGRITVRNALSRSLNIPSVLVMQKLGIDNAVSAAKRMGVSTLNDTDYGLSLALGSAEVPLVEMTNIYSAFANKGVQYEPYTIQNVKDKYDATLFQERPNAKQVITEQGAYLISSILSDNTARAPIFGSSLTVSGRTVAVKTGTTDEARDAWTIGYTPQLAIGVWVGNNDNTTMLNGGSGMAGPIWRQTMQQALQGKTVVSFSVPSGVVQRFVCIGTESIASTQGANTFSEYFLSSAQPSGRCNTQQAPVEDTKKDEEPTDDTTDTQTDTGTGTGSGAGTGSGSGTGTTSGGTGSGTGTTTGGSGTGTGSGAGNGSGTGSGSGTPANPGSGGAGNSPTP
ncbi:MAG: putative Peptidoglycan glycosyltransferase [Candidatus Saccharibacteria bacterium]|nr:putative Peptidoglycan glycosyltransferase [Candidatus Saccharibacteria bacterium]